MSRLIIYLYCCVLLFVGGHAETETDENSIESDDDYIPDEREQMVDDITNDYLQVLDYEMEQSKSLFEQVLVDAKIHHTHSEILQSKKLILKDFIEFVKERQQRQMPPKSHRSARFFHVFGKSLLYKDFLSIVARLQIERSRYNELIEDALFEHGLEDFLGTLRVKRAELIEKIVRKIEKYVNGLTAAQRRKAVAQKLVDWTVKVKDAATLEKKMDLFREFLRYEYLEVKAPVS